MCELLFLELFEDLFAGFPGHSRRTPTDIVFLFDVFDVVGLGEETDVLFEAFGCEHPLLLFVEFFSHREFVFGVVADTLKPIKLEEPGAKSREGEPAFEQPNVFGEVFA